jgi:predicted  nucleic acid-binding Zn-ribbon protein
MEKLEIDSAKMDELLQKFSAMLEEKSTKGESIFELTKTIGQLNSKIEEKFDEMARLEQQISNETLRFDSALQELGPA